MSDKPAGKLKLKIRFKLPLKSVKLSGNKSGGKSAVSAK